MHLKLQNLKFFDGRQLLAVFVVVLLFCAIGFGLVTNRTAKGATLGTMNFQARLMNGTGSIAQDGNYNIEFKLYDTASTGGTAQGVCSGNCVWMETRTGGNVVTVANGYVTVNLGSVTAFGSTIEWDQDLWLTMNVGGTGSPSWDGEMSPRLKLTAVPYAFRAGQLARLGGGNTGVLELASSFTQDTVITLPDPGASTATVCYQNSTACGFVTGGSTNFIQNGTGVQTAANFNIRSANIGSVGAVIQGANGQTADLLNLQTYNGTTSTTVFGVNNVGALTLAGTGTTLFTTFKSPTPDQVPTKINIPGYDPGAFGQILAFGLPSGSNATSRAISVFDARSGAHQPTIAVLSPNENEIGGFSWDGSNSAFLVKNTNSSGTIGLNVNGVTRLSATTAGALVNGVLSVATLGTADTATYLCRNTATDITACNTTGNGAAFVQGGNDFNATAVLGTTDTDNLQVITNNVTRAIFDTSNGLYLGNGVTAASPNNFTVASTGSTTAGTPGANLTVQGGAGASATTGSVGGNVTIAGGNAGGSGNNAGGDVILQGGQDSNSGTPGKVVVKNSANSTSAFQVQNSSSNVILNVDAVGAQASITGILAGSQGFEGVTFPPASPGTWTTGGDTAWSRTTAQAQEGAASAASGTIGDSQSSYLDLDYTFTTNGLLKFYWQVDNGSEEGFDFLYLCVDNDGCSTPGYAAISGTETWTEVTVPVTSGAHTFRWIYTKDSCCSDGADKAWLDNVRIYEGGNLSVDSNITAQGRVGIGTTAPSTALHVIGGTTLQALPTDPAALQVNNGSGNSLFRVSDEFNEVRIGNYVAGDGTAVLFVLDEKDTAGDPSTLLTNGAMYYNSNAGKFKCYQGSAWVDCISSLQGAYDVSGTPASITTSNGKDLLFNMADTATDANFLVDLQCDTSCSTNGRFAIQDDGSDVLTVSPAAGGITIGSSTLNTPVTITAGTGTITVGQSTVANTISIGSADITSGTPTQTINISNGTLTSGATLAVNILSGAAGSAGTATLSLGNNDRVTTIDVGNVATDANRTITVGGGATPTGITDTVNIGTGNTVGTGAKVINIGNGTPAGTNTVTIGSIAATNNQTTIQGGNGTAAVTIIAAASGNINIGTNNVSGKVLNIGSVGSTVAASTVHIADTTDATNAQVVTIGSTAANTGNITVVQGGSNTTQSIQLLPNTAGGVLIGATAGTGTITLGQSTATNTISIGSTNLSTGTPTQTTNIANGTLTTGATLAVNILSGGAGTAGTATLSLANNDRVTQVDIGNIAPDAARTFNLFGGNSAFVDTINIGAGNGTVAGAKTINIGTGTPSGSGSNLVTIGSTALASNTTLQAGTAGLVVNTGGTVRGTFDTSNNLYLGNASISGTAASPSDFTVRGTGGLNAATTGGALTMIGGTGNTSGQGGAVTIQGGTGGNAATGGVLNLRGGTAGGGNTNGANVVVTGGTGTGTGVLGLISLAPTMFVSSGATQTFNGGSGCPSCSVTGVDSYSSIAISASVASLSISIPVPNAANQQVGRIIYITAVSGSQDFTIVLGGTSIAINMKANSTATLVWNGTGWTAAGASSSTDLQSAYNNTQASAGAAELVLNPSGGAADGLTIRNNGTTPIVGGILEVQTSIGSNLFSVNNNATEYANNGGAESSTFTMWVDASTGGAETVARNTTTTGNIIATGQASTRVDTTTVVAQGAENTLSSTLSNGLKYQVSYSIKAAASSFTALDTMYSYDGSATNVRHCVSGTPFYSTGTASQSGTTITGVGTTWTSAMIGKVFVFANGSSTLISGFTNATTLTAATSQTVSTVQNYGAYNAGYTVSYGTWSRVTCTFVAPPTGTTITASNSVMIRQTDTTSRTFYIDNLSVTVGADANHAVDGSVDDATNFAANWTDFDGGTGSTTLVRNTTTIYDTSASTEGQTTANATQGTRNNMSIAPSINTQYLVTFYARASVAMTDTLSVGFLPAGGTTAPTGDAACSDYSTRSLSTSSWTKITCLFTTAGTAVSNPDLVIFQTDGTARSIFVDALSVTLNTNTASNVQIGGANKGGPTTLFTLDRSSSAPIAANNDAYLGSMYYDTTSGRIQCYEADGWGACGAAPDNIVNLNPEYAGAVLNGSGIGTMTADFCSDDTALQINISLCETGQAKNFYKWTSPQATQQTYSIYVTYQLPATFNGFSSDDTVQLVARVDSTSNASVTYEMFKSTGSAVTQCGTSETNVITGGGGSANTWYSYGINGNESTGCGFNSGSAGNFVIFKINLKANTNASAYVGTLSFTTTGR